MYRLLFAGFDTQSDVVARQYLYYTIRADIFVIEFPGFYCFFEPYIVVDFLRVIFSSPVAVVFRAMFGGD